ncbi:MAG: TIGR04190 family B12-binding domain/radical SAM domain protein [Deltaproteobacteria bacterium]|nr:TIGR04190 family B12-binding domain/radical SAM domain protein [Deltaproteobacteria bacterium]
MPRYDLVLLHAPSVYDFRKKPAIYGPISDVIPPGPNFEMYPIGMISISEHLVRAGFEVRIVNLAMKMLEDPRFDVERFLGSLDARLFGIDLHWLPHVNGALAVAEIAKRLHPRTPIVFGGFSTSFFHEELLSTYPFVDFAMRGDSTEGPMVDLVRAVVGGTTDFSEVPNLSWRNAAGAVVANPLGYKPADLDHVFTNYEHAIRQTVRHLDFTGYQPFETWDRYPITAVFTCRGCVHNCRTCGGGAHFFHQTMERGRPTFKAPELVARDMKTAETFLNAPIFIIGDILQHGEEYARRLLAEVKRLGIRNEVVIEFFDPPSRSVLEAVADAIPRFNLEISPESHDEQVRYAFGRPFGNEALERFIGDALELGCRRFDLFFMTGLPQQTPQSVLDTVDYCDRLLGRFGQSRRLFPFISPLAPFVDPGSAVWEHPEKYGYRLLFTRLEELRRALESPSWKYFLNYETEWMSRDEIVYTTYEAGARLNDVKERHGLISGEEAGRVREKNRAAVAMMRRVDAAMDLTDPAGRERALARLRDEIRDLDTSTVCDKSELDWPTGLLKVNLHRVIPLVVSELFRKLARRRG